MFFLAFLTSSPKDEVSRTPRNPKYAGKPIFSSTSRREIITDHAMYYSALRDPVRGKNGCYEANGELRTADLGGNLMF
jgi:hypothetical protein